MNDCLLIIAALTTLAAAKLYADSREEAGYQRGWSHGLRKSQKITLRAKELHEEVTRLRHKVKSECNSHRAILAKLRERRAEIPPQVWEAVFGRPDPRAEIPYPDSSAAAPEDYDPFQAF